MLVELSVTNTDWSEVVEDVTGLQADGGTQSSLSLVLKHPVIKDTVTLLVPDDSGGNIEIVDDGNGNLDEVNGASGVGSINYTTGEITGLDLTALTSATVASSGAILASFEWKDTTDTFELPQSLGQRELAQDETVNFTVEAANLFAISPSEEPEALKDLRHLDQRGRVSASVNPVFADERDSVENEVEVKEKQSALGKQGGTLTLDASTKTVSLPHDYPDATYRVNLGLETAVSDAGDIPYVSSKSAGSFDVSTSDGAAPASNLELTWTVERF